MSEWGYELRLPKNVRHVVSIIGAQNPDYSQSQNDWKRELYKNFLEISRKRNYYIKAFLECHTEQDVHRFSVK